MLVLSRRRGEVIRINDYVRLTILEIRHGGKVRIGVEAPDSVKVHREEVYDLIHEGEQGEHNEANPPGPPVTDDGGTPTLGSRADQ